MTSTYDFYDFERYNPPCLTEQILLQELKRREWRKQALLIGIASILFYMCMILGTILMSQIHMLFGLVGIGTIIFSLMSNGILSIVFVYYRRRRGFV